MLINQYFKKFVVSAYSEIQLLQAIFGRSK